MMPRIVGRDSRDWPAREYAFAAARRGTWQPPVGQARSPNAQKDMAGDLNATNAGDLIMMHLTVEGTKEPELGPECIRVGKNAVGARCQGTPQRLAGPP